MKTKSSTKQKVGNGIKRNVSGELPNDFTVKSMVSFLKDQAGDKVSADYVDGYRTGLMKMKSMMLDIIERMK